MSDIEDNVRWAHEAYYLAETGEHLGSAMQVDPSHDAAIRAVIKATREQVARDALPAWMWHVGDTSDISPGDAHRAVTELIERHRVARGES